jgi:hypothetical protein
MSNLFGALAALILFALPATAFAQATPANNLFEANTTRDCMIQHVGNICHFPFGSAGTYGVSGTSKAEFTKVDVLVCVAPDLSGGGDTASVTVWTSPNAEGLVATQQAFGVNVVNGSADCYLAPAGYTWFEFTSTSANALAWMIGVY